MKSVLSVFAFALCFIIGSCNNNHETANDNNLDSIGNPSDSPTSTSILTTDSADLKDADTSNVNH